MRDIFEYQNNINKYDDYPSVLKWGNDSSETNPVISIIMPVYNHPDYFEKALTSALNQVFAYPYEIIVIDNNYDGNIENVNVYESIIRLKNNKKIRYYKNSKNIGCVGNYNRGVILCNSQYFTYLHDDDEFTNDTLQNIWNCRVNNNLQRELVVPAVKFGFNLSSLKEKTLIYNKRSFFDYIKHPGLLLCYRYKGSYKMNIFDWFLESYTNGGAVLHHKESFITLGGFSEDFGPVGDYSLYTAYCARFGAFYYPKAKYLYRIAENETFKVYKQCIEYDEYLRKQVKERILLPNFLLDRIIVANKHFRMQNDSNIWAGKEEKYVTKWDKLYFQGAYTIKSIINYFCRID